MVGRLHFVTGKGGVGKSTVAAALALGLTGRGKRVLAIELSPPAGLSRLLGARPEVPSQQVQVRGELYLTYFDGEIALGEYLHQRLPVGPLLDTVFAHPLYRAFVQSAPGLRELMAVGKIRDELRRMDGLHHRWDAIVIDAGATGHALEHLRMPAAAEQTFGSGLVHRESHRIVSLFQDPEHTTVHVVALPEEMPLKEAAELIEKLRELGIPVGQLVVNRCREPAPAGIEDALGTLDSLPLSADRIGVRDAIRAATAQALGWLRIQEEGIGALEERTKMAAKRLPRLPVAALGDEDLARFAEMLVQEEES